MKLLTSTQNLPLARLRVPLRRQHLQQLIKHDLHILATLALGHFVRFAQFGRTTVSSMTCGQDRIPSRFRERAEMTPIGTVAAATWRR